MRVRTNIIAALAVALLVGGAQQALAGGGTVKGVVKWQDKPVKAKPIKVGQADPYCTRVTADNPLLSEKITINDNSTVKDVFVYVKSGLPAGKTWPVPTEPVLLDQHGCHYVPHVFGMMAGQQLLIRNSDDTSHNIHAVPTKNNEFNKGQPKKGMEFTETFTNTEMMVRFKCDVHSWMEAYCAVMDHPFFATTNDKGEFQITGLPPGDYVLSTWQERIPEPQEMTVSIKGDETQQVEFVFQKPKKGGSKDDGD